MQIPTRLTSATLIALTLQAACVEYVTPEGEPIDRSPRTVARPAPVNGSAGSNADDSHFPRHFAGDLFFVDEVVTRGGEDAGYEVDVRFPQLTGSSDPRVRTFNRGIETLVHEKYRWSEERGPESEEDRELPGIDRSTITYTIEVAEPEGVISVSFLEVSVGAGAATAHQSAFSSVFDFRAGRFLELKDLFRPRSAYLKAISEACLEEIRQASTNRANGFLPGNEERWIRALEPRAKNFGEWTLGPGGINFTFDECVLRVCMYGTTTVTVPFTSLEHVLSPDRGLTR